MEGDDSEFANFTLPTLKAFKSLGCFHFQCILSSQWKAVTVNFTLPALKAFLEARNQSVSANKQ